MKPSAYNYRLRKTEGEIILYNTLNDSFIALTDKEYDALNKECLSSISKDCLETLFDNGFIVDDKIDERAILRYKFERARYATENLVITLAPTLNCNFACPYCYETPREGYMSDTDFGHILGFIKERFDDTRFKKLQVNWYGGEPMLCFSSITSWSRCLIQFCEERNIAYTSHMITNGSLINSQNIELIKDCCITNIQMTIDGWGEEHDKRRRSKDGSKYFNTIIDAVLLAAKTDIEVSCRMNVDANNVSDYYRLADRFQHIPNVYVHIGHLRDYGDLPTEVFRCFTCEEFSAEECAAFKRSGYSVRDLENIFSKRHIFCGACAENSYVIDEQCNVYKCWNDIGNPNRIIFNLNEDEADRRINFESLCAYMAWNPFDDPNCGQCIWMPICGGGCLFEKEELGAPFCYPPVYTVDEYLDMYLKEVYGDEGDQKG